MADYRFGKNPCPKCRKNGEDKSGDNFFWYGEGRGGHCWSCGFTIPSDEFKEGTNVEEEKEEQDLTNLKDPITEEEAAHIKEITGTRGYNYRLIPDAISKYFGVRYQYDEESGNVIGQFTPITKDGELTGYKVRAFPKKFSAIGQVSKYSDMVGEFRFKSSKHVCVIVGGETKQLNAYRMLKEDLESRGKGHYDPPAVVAPCIGESGAYKQIKARYKFFEQFEKIVVCMDNDEAGKQAAQKIAKALPKGRVFIMDMRYKDADDYVVDKNGEPVGKEREFIKDYWNAKPWTPSGIVSSGGLAEKIREAAKAPRVPLPPFMRKLQDKMAGGIPLRTIINMASASGTGKSTIIDECLYFWIYNSPYKPGIVSLESDAGQYGTKLLSRHMGRKIDLISTPEEKLAYLDQEDVIEAERSLYYDEAGIPRFLLIDDRDDGVEALQKKIEELIISFNCQLIVLDPLQDILEGMSNEQQALFSKWMKGMVKSHEVIFVCVNHVRKSQGNKQANSTGAEMFEEDIQGSSSIFKSGACNLLFSRNKEAEDPIERNTTYMKASKIRWTGLTGHAGQYYYDNATHTMWDLDDWKAKHHIQGY